MLWPSGDEQHRPEPGDDQQQPRAGLQAAGPQAEPHPGSLKGSVQRKLRPMLLYII